MLRSPAAALDVAATAAVRRPRLCPGCDPCQVGCHERVALLPADLALENLAINDDLDAGALASEPAHNDADDLREHLWPERDRQRAERDGVACFGARRQLSLHR